MRCHRACSSRPPGPPPASAQYGRTRGPGRDHPRGGHSPGPPPGPAHPPAPPADPDRAARAGVPPPVPVKPGARPPGHARQSGDVCPALGGLAGRQPWRGAGCVPRVRRSRGSGRPATGCGRIRPVCGVDDAAEVSPGRGRSWAEPAAAAATASPARRRARARSGRSWPGPALMAAVSRVTARPPGRSAGRAGAQQNAMPGWAPAACTRCRGRSRCGRPARRRAAGRRPGSRGQR